MVPPRRFRAPNSLVIRKAHPLENIIAIFLIGLERIQRRDLDRRHRFDHVGRAPLGDQGALGLRIRLEYQCGDAEFHGQAFPRTHTRQAEQLGLQLVAERPCLRQAPGDAIELAELRDLSFQEESLAFEGRREVDERMGPIRQRPVEAGHAGRLDQVFEALVQDRAGGDTDQRLDQEWPLTDVPSHGKAGLEPVESLIGLFLQDRDPDTKSRPGRSATGFPGSRRAAS